MARGWTRPSAGGRRPAAVPQRTAPREGAQPGGEAREGAPLGARSRTDGGPTAAARKHRDPGHARSSARVDGPSHLPAARVADDGPRPVSRYRHSRYTRRLGAHESAVNGSKVGGASSSKPSSTLGNPLSGQAGDGRAPGRPSPMARGSDGPPRILARRAGPRLPRPRRPPPPRGPTPPPSTSGSRPSGRGPDTSRTPRRDTPEKDCGGGPSALACRLLS